MIYSNISIFMQNRYYGANFTDKQTAFLIPYLHRYREDTDELHNYLNELKRVLVEEDQERLSKEQLDRRRRRPGSFSRVFTWGPCSTAVQP